MNWIDEAVDWSFWWFWSPFIVQRRAKNNKTICERSLNVQYSMQSGGGGGLMTLAQSVVEGHGERGSKIHWALYSIASDSDLLEPAPSRRDYNCTGTAVTRTCSLKLSESQLSNGRGLGLYLFTGRLLRVVLNPQVWRWISLENISRASLSIHRSGRLAGSESSRARVNIVTRKLNSSTPSFFNRNVKFL
jgi:hypothetical protein